MANELEFLEELQTIDLEILKQRKELNAIPQNLQAMRNDVAHVGEILQREKERLEEAEQWRLDREKDIVLQNDLLNKSKIKLQAVRNEKEQKAAQREIDAVRKTIQEREEETLKVMEASEQYRSAIEEHTAEFAELEKQLKDSEDEGKVNVLLKQGKARIAVRHRKHTAWTVSAGPYRVSVTGTRFDVEWDPKRRRFRLDLSEGEVVVFGPMVTEGQKISSGHTFVADMAQNEVKLSQLSASIERRIEYDRDSKLTDQMHWLSEAGFTDVDCLFKYFFVGVFYALKE